MNRLWICAVLLACACGNTAAQGGAGEDVAGDGAGGTDAGGSGDVGDPGDTADSADATAATDALADTSPDPDTTIQDDAKPGDVAADLDSGADTGPDSGPDAGNGCCQSDSQCAFGQICIAGKDCVAKPGAGECYSDADCTSGTCQGAFVCGCTADCNTASSVGKCVDTAGGCCGKGGTCASGEQCVGSVCKPANLPAGTCWSDADCKTGTCQGASVCPCGASCIVVDKAGQCVDNVKPGGCCKNGAPCAAGETCAHGPDVCKPQGALASNQCWADVDCPAGTCQGANVCPCGAMCLVADKPGTCSGGPSTCITTDPMSFGMCDMVIGVVFDGKSCVMASGCGCGKLCNQVYATLSACEQACGI